MKEAIVSKGPKVEIIDSPIPEPNEDQVLIKVVVSGSNPKDWKLPQWLDKSANEGDDIAGVVAKVGANVTEFKPGDRVAAFHEMRSPHGSYAEYAIAWQHTTFHIPASTTFEEAATIPLAAMTAAVGLYLDQGLPQPWTPATEPIPLIVYGASSAVGAFAVQLAQKSNIHPIITVAGSSSAFVETLIDRSKGDTIVDYRGGEEATVTALKKAIGSQKVFHAFDAISENNTSFQLSEVIEPGGKINTVLGWPDFDKVKKNVVHAMTGVGKAHNEAKDLAFVYFRFFGRGLQEGWFKPHPYEVAPGGLAAIEDALTKLRSGKVHASKFVFRIQDTKGAGKDTV